MIEPLNTTQFNTPLGDIGGLAGLASKLGKWGQKRAGVAHGYRMSNRRTEAAAAAQSRKDSIVGLKEDLARGAWAHSLRQSQAEAPTNLGQQFSSRAERHKAEGRPSASGSPIYESMKGTTNQTPGRHAAAPESRAAWRAAEGRPIGAPPAPTAYSASVTDADRNRSPRGPQGKHGKAIPPRRASKPPISK